MKSGAISLLESAPESTRRLWQSYGDFMNLYRPKSVLSLILIGFAVVALPLVIALGVAVFYVDKLVEQSERAVEQTVQVTSHSRMLVEEITAMERSARQFLVLDDQVMFSAYAKTHQEMLQTTAVLAALQLEKTQREKLGTLKIKAQALFKKLSMHTSAPAAESMKAVAEFVELSDMAQAIFTESSELVDRKVEILQHTAGKAQKILVWSGLALIPWVIGLTWIFTLLITRPIRHIDQAIRQLGDAKLTSPITITGPQDLESLGRRLDWLRLRLIKLEEDRRKFLRNISHDLKTPLAAIREGSELLVDEVGGKLSEEQRDIARILRQNGIQLQRMIEDLLNFSIAGARSARVEFGPVRLHELIDRVIDDHRPVLMSKNIKLQKECVELIVAGDKEKLRVVIDNLLSNAVKYTPPAGTIQICLARASNPESHVDFSKEADVAVLDVIDTGPGIQPNEKDKIFETFYRGEIPHDGYIKGSGLGLSITKEYVMAHEGSIEVIEGTADSRGAHLRVTLPVSRA